MTDLVAIDGEDRGGPTAVEIDLRVAEIVKLMLDGARRGQLIAHGAAQWGVSSRTIDRYIAAARAEIRADWEVGRVDALAALLSRLAELESLARKSGQLSVALGCLNAQARLAQITTKTSN